MPRTVLGAVVAAVGLLLAGLAAWGLWMELPAFWDPCQEWGIGGGGSGGGGSASHTIHPGDPCQHWSGTSETRLGAVLRLSLVHGVGLVTGGLAVVGGWRRRPLPALVAGLLMAGESVLLFFGLSIVFLLTAAASVLFLVAWRRWSQPL